MPNEAIIKVPKDCIAEVSMTAPVPDKVRTKTQLQVHDGPDGVLHHDESLRASLTMTSIDANFTASSRITELIPALVLVVVLDVAKAVDVRHVCDGAHWIHILQKPVKRLAFQTLSKGEHVIKRANVDILGVPQRLTHHCAVFIHPNCCSSKLVLRKVIPRH